MAGTTSSEGLTRHFYDRISGAYDLLADSNEKAARDRGLALLAAKPGERALEIGYGTGHSLVELANAVGPKGHVAGVDISEGMYHVATRRIDQAGLSDRVKIQVATVPPLPYPDASFDAAWMSFTLELFPLETIPAVLREIRRVLKPGGRLGVVSMALSRAGEHDSALERTYKWMHIHFRISSTASRSTPPPI
jgi:demethylmenaquinone methyltransferase/2-methoxy-6-polyprenyl-1,4-benzoquinol methylase